MTIEYRSEPAFELEYPVIVVGAGACGYCTALAVRDSGLDVLLLEQDKTPLGTTSMSTGLIPAAGTPEQADAGLADGPAVFFDDIMGKHGGLADAAVVQALAETSADTVAWLRDRHGLPLSLIDGFTYPGHSFRRMYGTPNRSGAELLAGLQAAGEAAGVDLLTQAKVTALICRNDSTVAGVKITRPGGAEEEVGCRALVLGNCGFAGSPDMIREFIPEMTNAVIFSHLGNRGDALRWGQALGAGVADLGSYQGHGGLANDAGVPILWPLIMEGGFQVNADGERFSDETKGYSEQAATILKQPGGRVWSIFDQRLYELMTQFGDFRDAIEAGAVKSADTPEALAAEFALPPEALKASIEHTDALKRSDGTDDYGRSFAGKPEFVPPIYGAKVTGALFHTQGGLVVDPEGRVLNDEGQPLPNLFAGGGAARGVSGPGSSGYIAGNGLLTATSLGKLAGYAAARLVQGGAG